MRGNGRGKKDKGNSSSNPFDMNMFGGSQAPPMFPQNQYGQQGQNWGQSSIGFPGQYPPPVYGTTGQYGSTLGNPLNMGMGGNQSPPSPFMQQQPPDGAPVLPEGSSDPLRNPRSDQQIYPPNPFPMFDEKGSGKSKKSTNGKTASFECKKCYKSFTSRHDLRVHKQTKHSERIHQRQQCGTTFSNKGNLNKHVCSNITLSEVTHDAEHDGNTSEFNDHSNSAGTSCHASYFRGTPGAFNFPQTESVFRVAPSPLENIRESNSAHSVQAGDRSPSPSFLWQRKYVFKAPPDYVCEAWTAYVIPGTSRLIFPRTDIKPNDVGITVDAVLTCQDEHKYNLKLSSFAVDRPSPYEVQSRSFLTRLQVHITPLSSGAQITNVAPQCRNLETAIGKKTSREGRFMAGITVPPHLSPLFAAYRRDIMETETISNEELYYKTAVPLSRKEGGAILTVGTNLHESNGCQKEIIRNAFPNNRPDVRNALQIGLPQSFGMNFADEEFSATIYAPDPPTSVELTIIASFRSHIGAGIYKNRSFVHRFSPMLLD